MTPRKKKKGTGGRKGGGNLRAVLANASYLEADREFGAEEVAPLGLAVHRHLRAGQVHAHLLRVAS